MTKLKRKELDVKIQRIIFLQQESKRINDELKNLKILLEKQYSLSDDQREIIRGINYEMEKIPVNLGKNNYAIERLVPILKLIKGAYKKIVTKIIKVEYKVNTDELYKLINDGILPEIVLDICRIDDWTFKTKFKRIEFDNSKGRNLSLISKN